MNVCVRVCVCVCTCVCVRGKLYLCERVFVVHVWEDYECVCTCVCVYVVNVFV